MPPWPVPEALKVPSGWALIASSSASALAYSESAATITPPGSALTSARMS